MPRSVGGPLLRKARALADRIGPGVRWPLLGVVAGLLPFPLALIVDWRSALVVPSLLLAILLVCAAARDWQCSGIALLVAAFGAHSLVMLSLASHAPAVVQHRFPDGVAYWQQTRHWIFTGENPEYETARWLSEHALLFVQVLIASYISFGFLPVFVGFFQINLMNVYVGNLLTHAQSPALALGLGWHPWSVLRGIGFLLVTFEVVSYSLQRLASTPLSTPRRRVWRWGLGIGFLILDAVVKYSFLDACRETLLYNWSM